MEKNIWSVITSAIALTIGGFTLTTPVMAKAVGNTNSKNTKTNMTEFNFKSFNKNISTKEKNKDLSCNGGCTDFVSNVKVQGIRTDKLSVEFNLNKPLNISLSEKSNVIIKCYNKEDIVLISKFKYYDEYLISDKGYAYGLSKPILQDGKYFIIINNKDTNINVSEIVKVELVFVDSDGCSKKMVFKNDKF